MYLRATISENNLGDTVELRYEGLGIDRQSLHRAIWDAKIRHRCLKIGGRVRNSSHGDDQHNDVQPNGSVCNPAELLQCSDLTQEHSYEGLSSFFPKM